MNEKQFVDAIESAIRSEIEAYEFYQNAAEKMDQKNIKEMFLSFAGEEKKHKTVLEDVLAEGTFELVPMETRDYKVAETVDLPELSTDMKPADAIALAMKKEELAMKRYAELADELMDQGLKDLFLELAAMEREHKFKMEKMFVETGYPEVW